jgi:hypothetical protein
MYRYIYILFLTSRNILLVLNIYSSRDSVVIKIMTILLNEHCVVST